MTIDDSDGRRIEDKRQTGNRRTPANLMGRRESDRLDIGEWIREHYVDPVIEGKIEKLEARFEESVKKSTADAVKAIAELIEKKDASRDWRTVSIGAMTAFLVSGLVWAWAKLKGWV